MSRYKKYKMTAISSKFNDASFIGREITFKVEGRCGDPEAGTQTKSITATLDDGGDAPKVEYAYSDGHEDERNTIVCDDRNTLNLIGTGLTGASVRLVFTHDGEFREVDVPADKITGSDKHLKIDGEWIADNLPPETMEPTARALCNAKSHPPLDQLESVQIKAGRKRPRAQLRTDR